VGDARSLVEVALLRQCHQVAEVSRQVRLLAGITNG
jgi:hypothetical protein